METQYIYQLKREFNKVKVNLKNLEAARVKEIIDYIHYYLKTIGTKDAILDNSL